MRYILLFLLIQCSLFAGDWEFFLEEDASFSVRHEGETLVKSSWLFWGAQWKWSSSSFSSEGDHISGRVDDLGLSFEGQLKEESPGSWILTYRIHASQELKGIIGGGLEFQLTPHPSSFPHAQEAERIEKRGWKKKMSEEEWISLEGIEGAHHVVFERGNTSQVRFFLIKDRVKQGWTEGSLKWTLPKDCKRGVLPRDRYGEEALEEWVANPVLDTESPVDLSYLNHIPAGKYGKVLRRNGRLEFENGLSARFWGTNLAAYALFVDKDTIDKHAERLAQQGYNLVRIHHHDSTAWVPFCTIDTTRDDSRHLNEDAMERLDYWIHALKERGIYVWLDLHVGREFRRGDGPLMGLQELFKSPQKPDRGEGKGFCYLNGGLQDLMQEFTEAYLKHQNRFTGLAYKDDPAIAGLLVTNENDMTVHFGHQFLDKNALPYHHDLFQNQAKNFSEKTKLPMHRLLQTWVPGASKYFLSDLEHQFNESMLEHLKHMKVTVPVATTNVWGIYRYYCFPSLLDGDLIDVHSYGKEEFLGVNPRHGVNFATRIAGCQVENWPLTVTEWNVPYPSRDRSIAPLYLASLACLQSWDALMHYAYAQDELKGLWTPGAWSTYGDPAYTIVMPLAALLYRRGDVSRAKNRYVLELSEKEVFDSNRGPATCRAVRTLAEQSQISVRFSKSPYLPWQREALPSSAEVLTEPEEDFLGEHSSTIQSDTGELIRNWKEGWQIIDTPKAQVIQGWLPSESIQLSDVSFQVNLAKGMLAVISLDGRPIKDSKHLLVVALGRTSAEGERGVTFYTEPVRGEVIVNETVYQLSGNRLWWELY